MPSGVVAGQRDQEIADGVSQRQSDDRRPDARSGVPNQPEAVAPMTEPTPLIARVTPTAADAQRRGSCST